MSRLGLRLAVAFAFVVVIAIALVTVRNVRLIEAAQRTALEAAAADQVTAVQRVVADEAGGIMRRIEPLASVRELHFRVQPGAQTPPLPLPAADTAATSDTATLDTATQPVEAPVPEPVSGPLDPAGLQRFVEEILPVTGLDALEVTDRSGEVLARGQYPESFGELRGDSLARLLEKETGILGVRSDPFRDRVRLVLFAAVPIQSERGDTFAPAGVLSGGVRLDRLAEQLGHLTGSIVEITAAGASVSSRAGSTEWRGAGLIAQGGEYYWAATGALQANGKEWARLRVLVPATEGVRVQQRLIRETVKTGVLAVVLAALAGIGLALGPTRRLARLTRAAVRIGGGDLDTPVEAKGTDEIGLLGETLARTAQSLKEERERLAQSERVSAWRDAARRLAHELKNAITPIGLALKTVQRAADKGEAGRQAAVEALTAIGEEIERLRSLVDQFSQFARLPAPRLAPYDLVKGLRSAATVYGSSETTIRFQLPDVMSPIQADEELISRVWSNLIANAVHAAGKNGTVTIAASVVHGGVQVEITDSGPGLPEERLSGAVAEGKSTKPGGWGVGLALAERIVTEHNGKLAFENIPTGGACVRVSLPGGEEPTERDEKNLTTRDTETRRG